MKIGKIVMGFLIVASIHSLFLNQDRVFGRAIIFETLTLYVLYVSLLAFFLLSGFERTKRYCFIAAPFAVVFSTEIVLSSLAILKPEVFSIYYAVFRLAEVPLIILILAVSISLTQFSEKVSVQSAISFASLLAAAAAAFQLVSILSPILPFEMEGEDLALVFLAFFLVLALTSLSNISKSVSFLRDQRAFLLGIVAAIAVYSIVIKPMIGERVGIANFVEWGIVAFATAKVARSLTRSIEIDDGSIIRTHKKSDAVIKDEVHSEIERSERAFIDYGVKEPLIIALVKYLGSTGIRSDLISECISPIIGYEDDKLPMLPFPWEKRLIELKNRRRRAKIVESIRKKLYEGGAEFERRI